MSFLRRLFGDGIPKEAKVNGEFYALLISYCDFGPMHLVRCCYTNDPSTQMDLSTLYPCWSSVLDGQMEVLKLSFNRHRLYCRSFSSPPPIRIPFWIRDFELPAAAFPFRDLDQQGIGIPLYLRETNKETVLTETPAKDFATYLNVRLKRIRSRKNRIVKAVLVQANIALFEPGDEDLPCLVLFTFDENFHEDRLHRWASELSAYKNTESDDPEIAAIAEITTDERFYFDKRWTLPRSLVGWHDVYAGGLYVHRRHLPNGFIDTRTLWCLAEPGEKGMIIHIESQD